MENIVRKVRAHPSAQVAGRRAPLTRRRGVVRGQTLAIVALMMLGLFAMVGLAIDGGSMYGQRREAQNAADGASLAGTRLMLDFYIDMAHNNPSDVDGSAGQENAILNAIETYAFKHGINTNANSGDLEAYFVNEAKQIVSVGSGQGGCGGANPCKVGQNNRVPWTYGAKGIIVRARAHTGAYFMAIFGHSDISAVASATAFMGVATSSMMEVGVIPIGFFTDTTSISNLEVGREYTLIQGSTSRGSGNWGYVNWNGTGESSDVVNVWLMCGFNPGVQTRQQWAEWCPPYPDEFRGIGPTMYWQGQPDDLRGEFTRPALEWPAAPDDWWWILGSTGTTNSTCQYFEDITPLMLNREYLVPIFEADNIADSGGNTKFHLLALGWFRITDVDIVCHPNQPPPNPGPPPGPGTPTPTPYVPQESHWSIMGEFLRQYSATGSGGHGDIRHTSNPTVFLSP
ncbi:MAG TPA: Tad domain-containing protein [Chloroflexia bacterium]|nr:Tad domain-containing protein [Chloroflexia bacterium]